MGGKPRPARETAWHFLAVDADGKPVLRDRRPLVLGKWLEHVGPIVLCESGLHASTRAIDALHYAPGSFVTLVEVADVAYRDEDKLVCARRRPLWGYDATPVLRGFARRVAKSRLCDWRGPVPQVVLDWLDTGDETRRSAAESAAESAAWSAARSAAGSAAWSAARSAAESAARSAAWSAARSAARSAAWSAAESAAESAAWSAARSAAWSAARSAAESAAESAYNGWLEAMLTEGAAQLSQPVKRRPAVRRAR